MHKFEYTLGNAFKRGLWMSVFQNYNRCKYSGKEGDLR